jgi:hypothetical protein
MMPVRAVARCTCTRGGYLRLHPRKVPPTTSAACPAPTGATDTACVLAVQATVATLCGGGYRPGYRRITAESAVAGLISK